MPEETELAEQRQVAPNENHLPKPANRTVGFDTLHGAEELLIEYLSSESEIPMPTGIRSLDISLAGGLRRKNLYVIAGRTGEGKSSLAMSIARRMAIEHKFAVLYMSLEMTKQELIERMICQATLTPLQEIEGLRTTGALVEKTKMLRRGLRKAWFHIEDLRGASLLELDAIWNEMQPSERKPDLLVVDHLQRVNFGLGIGLAVNRADAINQYVVDLTHFSKLKNIAVLLCCQINRQGSEKPGLIHLKGSGGIEENASAVMIGSRQNMDKTQTTEDKSADCEYDLWIAKHRRGPESKITLTFRPPCFEFLEPASYGQVRHPALETTVTDGVEDDDSIQL